MVTCSLTLDKNDKNTFASNRQRKPRSTVGCVVERLLKEAADDVRYRKRFQLLFGALLSVVGQSMRNELSKQDEFVRILSSVADKVKAAKDREVSVTFHS